MNGRLTLKDRARMRYMGDVARIFGKRIDNGIQVTFDCSSKEEVERKLASIKECGKVEVINVVYL